MAASNYLKASVAAAITGAPFHSAVRGIQLHTGDPGLDGLNNVSHRRERRPIAMRQHGAGLINETMVLWPKAQHREVATHFSLWEMSGPDGYRELLPEAVSDSVTHWYSASDNGGRCLLVGEFITPLNLIPNLPARLEVEAVAVTVDGPVLSGALATFAGAAFNLTHWYSAQGDDT